jgi:hypothetical protein
VNLAESAFCVAVWRTMRFCGLFYVINCVSFCTDRENVIVCGCYPPTCGVGLPSPVHFPVSLAAGFASTMADVEFVWYKHPVLCWSLGRVVKSHGLQITVADVKLHGEHTVNRAEVHPHDSSHDKNLSDIAFMNNMHEGAWLFSLQSRLCCCYSGCVCRCQAPCSTCCGVVTCWTPFTPSLVIF